MKERLNAAKPENREGDHHSPSADFNESPKEEAEGVAEDKKGDEKSLPFFPMIKRKTM